MRFRLIFSFLLLFSIVTLSQEVRQNTAKLVLSINIDQLRTDFLYEFFDLYGDNGFKRLMAEGRLYSNA